MKSIVLENINYKVFKNYRDGYDVEALTERYTEYFKPFDYILGDWSYGKLRLKGFYKKGHQNWRELNSFENIDNYIKTNCAYDARYFIIEKVIE